MIVGAIVAVAGLPSHLGLTHEEREKHRAITLDPVSLTHRTLAAFSSELEAHEAGASRLHDRGPRLTRIATSDGALLAQVSATAEDGLPDPAPPPVVGGSDGGTDESVEQPESATDTDGADETSPTPPPAPTPETTPTPTQTPTVQTTPPATTPPMTAPGPGEPPLPQSTQTKVASPDVPIVIPGPVTFQDLQQVAQEAQDTGLAGAGCAEDLNSCPGLTAMIGAALTDSTGAPVSVAVAAERLKRALPQMRRVETPDGPTVDGIEVAVTVHADDLEGATIFVKWQLIERGGGKLQLYGNWLSANSVYRLVPPSNDVDADLPLWVPWPPRRGRYGIRLLVYVDGTRFMHKDVPLKF